MPAICGDGIREAAEECDDGNDVDGDGCSSQCLVVGSGSEGLCSNGLDDDQDTLFDCNDPDCADASECTAMVVEVCDNANDDDLDGAIDCADSDCAALPECDNSTQETLCDNGRDDDDDGEFDCGDADCAGKACGSNGLSCAGGLCLCANGANSEVACTGGADDDCDGLVDCQDDDCATDPACANAETECADGIDNDGNGTTDCADTNCTAVECGPNGRVCQMSACICPGGGTEMSCRDGQDNDCDGSLDCSDSDCTDDPDCMQRETDCVDGVDNDSDGDADCADVDCDGVACGDHGLTCSGGTCACAGGSSESQCGDMTDNDCDGDIDCADSDCTGESCGADGLVCAGTTCECPGGATETSCDDNMDNDCDGVADCDDPDCSAAAGCNEITCDDSQDNDGDGDADCQDMDCDGLACGANGQVCSGFACTCPTGASEAGTCADQIDNDCDGDLDCDDSECTNDPACGFVCDADLLLLCNLSHSGTTVGQGSDIDAYSCHAEDESGPETIYSFVATTDSTVTVTLSNATADLDLQVLQDTGAVTCDPNQCADSSTTGGTETVTIPALAGDIFYFAVDGKNGASGTYDIEVGCQGGSSCAATFPVGCGFSESYTTTNVDATDNVDSYGCAPWDESGPEYTYLFVPDQDADVTISLSSILADLDLFVLPYNAGVCDPSLCTESGDTSVTFSATSGTPYLVVVDGFQGDSGNYSISMACDAP